MKAVNAAGIYLKFGVAQLAIKYLIDIAIHDEDVEKVRLAYSFLEDWNCGGKHSNLLNADVLEKIKKEIQVKGINESQDGTPVLTELSVIMRPNAPQAVELKNMFAGVDLVDDFNTSAPIRVTYQNSANRISLTVGFNEYSFITVKKVDDTIRIDRCVAGQRDTANYALEYDFQNDLDDDFMDVGPSGTYLDALAILHQVPQIFGFNRR